MSKRLYRPLSVVMVAIMIFSCSTRNYVKESGGKVKNVILIIGDGMGIAQLYSAMSVSNDHLNIPKTQFIGFSRTNSSDDYITDSAASGTAMATGHKTRNGMLGMTPDSVSVENLIELAHDKGLAGGVVSTSAIVHATPAAFVAHNINRNNYDEIALDFLKTRPEVFIGGGLGNFKGRSDGMNLITDLKGMGYTVVFDTDELEKADAVKLAGLMAPNHLPKFDDGRGNELSIAAVKAIETLSKNRKGFFLMIEGAQIDFGGHEHDTRYIVTETLDLDRTVGTVLNMAKNIGNTLVIVTADHETGGMALTGGDIVKKGVSADYSTPGHTGVAVPVFAYGPAAGFFTGFYDNTEIFEKIRSLLNL